MRLDPPGWRIKGTLRGLADFTTGQASRFSAVKDPFMKAPAVLLAALLLATSLEARQAPPPPASDAASKAEAEVDGEPLPNDAPKEPYELAAWCYGAMDQYLIVYSKIIPELRDIDRRFGSSVKNEKQPYADDMAAARDELTVLKGAVVAAEKASIKVIAPDGARAVETGREIWGPAEAHTKRELARAWLSWALPDRCDSNARELTAKSNLLGRALKYNGPSATDAPAQPVVVPGDEDAKPKSDGPDPHP
jgi:hypothetical protein